jgi:hypothetical protein
MSEKYFALAEGRSGADRWSYAPGQLELLNGAKDKAKKKACGTSSCPTPKPAKACRTSTTPTSPPSWARTRWRPSA